MTRISPLVSENTSTIILTLCCTRQHPSTPPDDCWISSHLDVAGVQGVDTELDADSPLREIWRNVSVYFGYREAIFPRHITPVNDKSNICTVNTSYCANVHCNVTVNNSLSAGLRLAFTDVTYSRQISSSSTTTWIVSGLTTLASVAVVSLACLVSAAGRFHRGRLRTAVAEMRVAMARHQSTAVEQCRCDRLLVDMLPPGVAERLKMGETVDPETFDVASVYFSDIVGFNDVALSCESPLVIVRLLNQVFRYSWSIRTKLL